MSHHLVIPDGAYHTITAPEHCAWPNLTLLPGGDIGAVIFNQPHHADAEGDVELWASSDGGYTWALRSQITRHEPGTNRMNVGAGLNQRGELVVLCSGWSLAREDGGVRLVSVLPAWACISGDGGRTWEVSEEVQPPPDVPAVVPFGKIVMAGDHLAISAYARGSSHLLRSEDAGRSWRHGSDIGRGNHSETDLLVTAEGHWLAAVRTARTQAALPRAVGLRDPDGNRAGWQEHGAILLCRSDDAGATWQEGPRLSLPGQKPAHLLQLADGAILITYGSRIPEFRGVMGRISRDGGDTWSLPFRVVGDFLPQSDHGYPSTVQLADGDLVTAYYCSKSPWYQRYHMGVVRWNLDMVPLFMPDGRVAT
ncbi:MAG: glycoside hydrolase [Armatimonadetes bacterium]|nr:glycoside hydrolase [Armatimonadota bacterium]